MAKGSKKAAGADDAGVLGSLPATRPARLGRRRGDDAAAKPAARAKPAAKKASPAAGKTARAKTPAAAKTASRGAAKPPAAEKTAPKKAAAPKATAARKAAAPKAAAPKAAAPKRPAPDRPAQVRDRGGPRPVRSGAPDLDAVPAEARPGTQPPSGAELMSTVVKAAGEVAQIGFTVGGQILKRAVDRLPKP